MLEFCFQAPAGPAYVMIVLVSYAAIARGSSTSSGLPNSAAASFLAYSVIEFAIVFLTLFYIASSTIGCVYSIRPPVDIQVTPINFVFLWWKWGESNPRPVRLQKHPYYSHLSRPKAGKSYLVSVFSFRDATDFHFCRHYKSNLDDFDRLANLPLLVS